MIVSTDYVYDSGKGNAMFSKNGRITNYQYKVFTDTPDDGSVKKTRSQIDKNLMPIPEEFIGNNEFLPLILQQANKQNYLDKLKSQQKGNNIVPNSTTQQNSNPNGIGSDLQNEEGSEDNPNSPIKSISQDQGSYSFKVISRNRPVITQKYYGTQTNPDPAHYRPSFNQIEKKEPTLKFKYSEDHQAKEKIIRVPDCIQANHPCSFDVRKALRHGGDVQTINQNTGLIKSDQDDMLMTREEVKEITGYYNNHLGLLNIPFEKQKERTKDVFLINPIPHDKRFEAPKYDMSVLSQNQVTNIPTLEKHTPRPELFTLKENQPSYDTNPDKLKPSTKLGLLQFEKITQRKPNDNVRPYQTPIYYDFKSIERGYSLLSDYKKPVGIVPIEKSYPRDESMYNFTSETLKLMKKKALKKEFSFSSYLPNSILKSEHSSRNSLASTAHSLLHNKSRQLSLNNGNTTTKTSRRNLMSKYLNNSDLLYPDKDLQNLQKVDGSFLCINPKKKKLVDISRINITSREYVTGERSNSSFLNQSNFL
eukprot:403347437